MSDTPRRKTDEEIQELADRLTMLVSQLREAVQGQGAPPHPWIFDDWFSDYRTAHERLWG